MAVRAPPVGGELSLEQIAALPVSPTTGRVLPLLTLVGSLAEEREIKILVHLVRCRPNGFMGILPNLPEVVAVLESLVDLDENAGVFHKEIRINVEDSKGRRFGQLDAIIADFSEGCCQAFRRGPAIRGRISADLLRLKVEDSVARPSARAAWQASEDWIAEMAEDDSMHEYLTAAEEVQPVQDGGDSGVENEGHADVVAQLQARIMELESLQRSPAAQSPAPRVTILPEPPTRTHYPTQLFGMPGTQTGDLDVSTVNRLKSLAGPPPSRLSGLAGARAKAPPSVRQNAYAEHQAEAVETSELEQVLDQTTDPLQKILALQMQQTAALVQKLVKPPVDPITGALGNESGSSSSSGVRGCVARDAFLRTFEDVVGTGRIMTQHAAQDLGLTESQVDSGLMRLYVEKRIPLGDQKMLIYLAQFMACSWQIAYEQADELALGLMGRGIMMIEQFCLDGGRCQFGWLLSGMTEPNFGQISMNRKRSGLKPYSKLAAAPWVAANVAFLKDLDFLEGRLRNQKSTDRSEDKEEPAKTWQPRRKKKGNKDDPQDSTTASWAMMHALEV